MRTSEAKTRLAAFLDRLETQGALTAEKMALTGISLVVERLQRIGVEGASYSTNRLPAYYLKDKELNASGLAYFQKHTKDRDGVTWGEFRQAQGLQASHVDLTFSGRMLGGWVVLQRTAEGQARFVARTGGSDASIDAKLYYQVERYGPDTFNPTEAEQKEIDEIAEDDMTDLLKTFFS
jgi:hypothetical protein